MHDMKWTLAAIFISIVAFFKRKWPLIADQPLYGVSFWQKLRDGSPYLERYIHEPHIFRHINCAREI